MSYHFGKGEYNHLIGKNVGEFKIINIEYKPDNTYSITDGYAGKPHFLTLSNGETMMFRNFKEVVDKYGHLQISDIFVDVFNK